MTTEQLKLMAIKQSADEIQLSLAQLEGAMNALLQGPSELRRHGLRLQEVHSRIDRELKNIGYVVEQGQYPVAQAQLQLGQKVQQALTDITQI
ncbi:MAG TPA: hypothetical protein VFV52_04305 [Bacilli bacterium]|nr:hypothetical protein [Bacilli bacterium]